MNTSTLAVAAHRRDTSRRAPILILVLAALAAFLAFAPASADAAFAIKSWTLTPSTLQAAAHPNATFNLGPDAVANDKAGDDLKTVVIDFPAGALVNPVAATQCTASAFSADTCPADSVMGAIKVNMLKGSTSLSATGTMYRLPADPNNLMTFGFVLRPNGYRKVLLKSSNVSGLVSVRSDYGLTATVDAIPRSLTTTKGQNVNITVTDLSVTLNARSGAAQTGAYLTTNPTRCTAASSRATVTSYNGVVQQLVSSYTPTGCAGVPFTPALTVTPSTTTVGANTGVSSTISVPVADATIQQSHVAGAAVTLPKGTGLNTSALLLSGQCNATQLAANSCPSNSKIGTATVNVPLLTAPLTGNIYNTGLSSNTLSFGYVIAGGGITVTLTGTATRVDSNGDGLLDTVRTVIGGLPQAPFSAATLNFTSLLLTNPTAGCGSATATASIAGYSGANATVTTPYQLSGCGSTPPNATITSGPSGPTNANPATFSFTADQPGSTFTCAVDGNAFATCTAPYTTAVLAQGQHTFYVKATNQNGTGPAASRSFSIDNIAPALAVTSPTEGQSFATGNVSVSFTATDGGSGIANVTCQLDSGAVTNGCTSPVAYSGLATGAHAFKLGAIDATGNSATLMRNFNVGSPTLNVAITSPTSGSTVNTTDIAPVYSINGGTTPYAITCSLFDNTRDILVQHGGYYRQDGSFFPCPSGDGFDTMGGIQPGGDNYTLTVSVSDASAQSATSSVTYTTAVQPLDPPLITSGAPRMTTDQAQPTFTWEQTDNFAYPGATFQCAISALGKTTGIKFTACGGPGRYGSYATPAALAAGSYTFHVEAVSGRTISADSTQDFTVAPFTASSTLTFSTLQAGAHPDMDYDLKTPSGQLRKVDLLLPPGLLGALTAFPQCSVANAANETCPLASQIGTGTASATILGIVSHQEPSKVFLTAPYVVGDAAGLSVAINMADVGGLHDVIVPLRLRLDNNSQQMRIINDGVTGPPIPTQAFTDDGVGHDFFVTDFAIHLNGSQGSPYKLLTNPSQCVASTITQNLGSVANSAASAPIAYGGATGCASATFTPSFAQTFTSRVAGTSSGNAVNITANIGDSRIKRITVYEPPSYGINYPALGASADRCPSSSAVNVSPAGSGAVYYFDPAGCPDAAKIGTVTISSPLVPNATTGTVHLIQASPIPYLGIYVNDLTTGVRFGMVGTVAIQQVDSACDTSTGAICPLQVVVSFLNNAPDIPMTSFNMNLALGGTRTAADGTTQLSNNILQVASAGDSQCSVTAGGRWQLSPWSGGAAVSGLISAPATGC